MKIPPDILTALDATGLPYNVERGTRHNKIKIAGALAIRNNLMAVLCDPEGKPCIKGSAEDLRIIESNLNALADLASLDGDKE